MKSYFFSWPLACLLIALTGQLLPAPTHAQLTGVDMDLLTEKRWVDRAYGLSLRPPQSARLSDDGDDDSLLKMIDERGSYVMTLSVHPLKFNRLNLSPGEIDERIDERNLTPGQKSELMEMRKLQAEIAEKIRKDARTDQTYALSAEQAATALFIQLSKTILGIEVHHAGTHEFSRKIEVEDVIEPTREELLKDPMAEPRREKRELTIRHDACWVIYRARPSSKSEVAIMHGVVQITPQLFAVLELRGDWQQQESLQRIFSSVLASLEVADLRELVNERKSALKRSEQWRESLKAEAIYDGLIKDQFFRIRRDDRELGYLRVQQKKIEANSSSGLLDTGVQVTVQTRVVSGRSTTDSEARYYVSENNMREFWERSTATRTPIRGSKVQETTTTIETGTRLGDRIQINIEVQKDPGTGNPFVADRKSIQYLRPPVGYLSQAESWILPRILPLDVAAEYNFYWYNPAQQKITLRSDRITPALSRVVIETRHALYDPSYRSTYDRTGKLIKREMESSTELVPSTLAELRRLWKIN